MVDQTIDDLLAISCVEEEQSNDSPGPSQLIDNQSQLLRPIQQASASPYVVILNYFEKILKRKK